MEYQKQQLNVHFSGRVIESDRDDVDLFVGNHGEDAQRIVDDIAGVELIRETDLGFDFEVDESPPIGSVLEEAFDTESDAVTVVAPTTDLDEFEDTYIPYSIGYGSAAGYGLVDIEYSNKTLEFKRVVSE